MLVKSWQQLIQLLVTQRSQRLKKRALTVKDPSPQLTLLLISRSARANQQPLLLANQLPKSPGLREQEDVRWMRNSFQVLQPRMNHFHLGELELELELEELELDDDEEEQELEELKS